MSKRLYLLILFAVTLFCGCKDSNPLDSTTKVSFSIPARVLEDVGNNNGEEILVCTQVLRGSKVIIDEKYERTLFFDENNKPCIESIVLENIPLYTSLVLKMQIFVGEELFAEGQSEKTLFTEGKNTLNLQLKLIPKDDDEDDDPEPEDPADPGIELKIDQTSITVEEWEESATFTATEGFDSYNWSCGDQTSDTNSFTINVSDLSVGDYEVNLTATKGTKTYTAETSKLIVKAISKPLEISRIILSEDESLSIAKFTAAEGFSDFSWSCEDQRGYESEFTVDLSKLSLGEHKVNLTATKGTKTYTAETTFTVEARIIFGEITQSEVNIINESKEIINGYEKLIFKASEGFDSYTWKYANKTEIGESIEIDTSVLPLGKYVLQLLAVKNGIEYSAQVEFEIQNKISSNLVLIKDLVISIVDETIVDGTYYSITLSVPAGYDSYKWRCQNLTSDTNTFELIWDDLIDLDGGSPYFLVNVIAVKNGVEYSAEITL